MSSSHSTDDEPATSPSQSEAAIRAGQWRPFHPCAATSALFVCARSNTIFCLSRDTLKECRKLEKHKFDVALIAVDNVSKDDDNGRLAVSFDTGANVVIWDLLKGEEVASFVSYHPVRAATWLRERKMAFGNIHGSITIFDPSSAEHVAIQTIHDPINAMSYSAFSNSLAIGYENGSILVTAVQPNFTILHTIPFSQGSGTVINLAWHGTLSKQNTEMLATLSADGEVKIWGIPKTAQEGFEDEPRQVRGIDRPVHNTGRVWFAWSKNGRIVQYCNGDALVYDARTSNMRYMAVPVKGEVIGLAAHGPSGTLFTLTRDSTIYQYDLKQERPTEVARRHVHKATGKTPKQDATRYNRPAGQTSDAESSEAEEDPRSPLQRMTRNTTVYHDEERDQLGPLSPGSSRASTSSASSYGRRNNAHARFASPGSDVTTFSSSALLRPAHRERGSQSASIVSSTNKPSTLRQDVSKAQVSTRHVKDADLFPHLRSRLQHVELKVPQHGHYGMKVGELQRELLRVVFDWHESAAQLVRHERSHHKPGSIGNVLLSRWVGDSGADTLAQMAGSETMTSSDWMLLALGSQMGHGSQRSVGEAFVRRLLETGETHPAVTILLSLGEQDVAVEAYSARHCFLEAILLNSLIRPSDWQSQSQLLRRWGETLVAQGQTEFAVRCFSCASMTPTSADASSTGEESTSESDVKSLSPDMSTPISPPSAQTRSRLSSIAPNLKLVTNLGIHVKPIAFDEESSALDTVMSPGASDPWRSNCTRSNRERSESRTATPGSFNRQRLPSAGPAASSATRIQHTGSNQGSRTSSRRPGPSTTETRTPSTAATARRLAPGSSVSFGGQGHDETTASPRRVRSPEAPAQPKSVKRTDEPSFLDDVSRRVGDVMNMQASQSSSPEQPGEQGQSHKSTSAKRGHTRHVSDSFASTRSSMTSPGAIERPGSIGTRLSAVTSATRDLQKLTRKEIAALELEERRKSLARRPSVPLIPHPRDLVPRMQVDPAEEDPSIGHLLPPSVYARGMKIERSATADPAVMMRHRYMAGSLSLSTSPSTPKSSQSLVGAAAAQYGRERGANELLLLPTTYQRPPLGRSASAPPEELGGQRRRGSTLRKTSTIDAIPETVMFDTGDTARHNEPQRDGEPINPPTEVEEEVEVLPQLAHLSISQQPPAPPPVLSVLTTDSGMDSDTSGMISIAIDDPELTSPSEAGRSRGANRIAAASPASQNSKWHQVTRRMRSTSRSRSQTSRRQETESFSPNSRMMVPAPYETVLETLPASHLERGRAHEEHGQILQRGISPASAMVYRSPKEIRAAMPAEER